jgi:hypothetical protein
LKKNKEMGFRVTEATKVHLWGGGSSMGDFLIRLRTHEFGTEDIHRNLLTDSVLN